jgi:hypothetical protein
MSEDTLMGRLLASTRADFPSPALEHTLTGLHSQCDGLRQDLDRLAIQIEQLLRERTEILRVLSEFYHSELSMSSVRPLLDLARTLNPTLDERPVRS